MYDYEELTNQVEEMVDLQERMKTQKDTKRNLVTQIRDKIKTLKAERRNIIKAARDDAKSRFDQELEALNAALKRLVGRKPRG
jgi:hypothetical protein